MFEGQSSKVKKYKSGQVWSWDKYKGWPWKTDKTASKKQKTPILIVVLKEIAIFVFLKQGNFSLQIILINDSLKFNSIPFHWISKYLTHPSIPNHHKLQIVCRLWLYNWLDAKCSCINQMLFSWISIKTYEELPLRHTLSEISRWGHKFWYNYAFERDKLSHFLVKAIKSHVVAIWGTAS